MRKFQLLDPVSLKAFLFASQELNFTKAVSLAGLTQSGVSQHVLKLEQELGVSLIHRHIKPMKLTEAGIELKSYIENSLDTFDRLFEKLTRQKQDVSGLVRYAMPESCLYSPHFLNLLSLRKQSFPDIELRITICDSEDVMRLLLAEEIDFGFITKRIRESLVQSFEFAQEEFVLASGDRKKISIRDLKDLQSLKWINYPGMSEFFSSWIAVEFPKLSKIQLKELNIVGQINNLKGAIQMVQGEVGVGIFQKHCLADQIRDQNIFIHSNQRSGKKNPIYLISKTKEESPAVRVQRVIEAFLEIKKSSI